MVTSCGLSFRTVATMPSGLRSTRCTETSSVGGAAGSRKRSATSNRTINAMTPASSSTGSRIAIHSRALDTDGGVAGAGVSATTPAAGLGVTTRLHGLEHAHPAKFRELALVCMEHELPRIAECRLEDGAFALAQHDGVGVVVDRHPRAGAEDVEEHAVQVQAVDQVELGDVDDVHPDQASYFHPDRVGHVVVGQGVDGVDLVVAVEV